MGLSQRRQRMLARLGSRRSREREGLVVVEGLRACRQAADAGAHVRFALTSPRLAHVDPGALASVLEEGTEDVERLSDAELAALSHTEQHQGILLVCVQPRADVSAVGAGGRYLVLDALQDPGNVGTLIRSAATFGLDGVIALDGTADPWGPKAVRASAGMVFTLPVIQCSEQEALTALRNAGLAVVLADAAGRDPIGAPRSGGWALVVGNEGAGPRPAVDGAADHRVGIAMAPGAESLNAAVAGSILLHDLTREERGA